MKTTSVTGQGQLSEAVGWGCSLQWAELWGSTAGSSLWAAPQGLPAEHSHLPGMQRAPSEFPVQCVFMSPLSFV